MALKDTLQAAIADITTLEVATLTNKDDNELDMSDENAKNIFSTIRNNLKKTKLVAYSRFELDGDSVNYINNDDTYLDLVESHKEMVLAAQEGRRSTIETIMDALHLGNITGV